MKNLEELLSKEGLSKIKFPIERNYYTFGIKKKSGKIRKITAPSDNLKQIQNLILYRILYKVRPHFCATGFIPGFSIQSGAKQHIGNKALINIDLKNFFPSVKEEAVLETFREVTQMLKISFSGEDLKKLSSICCLDGGLPQGAPTSPVISNLSCKDLDHTLYEYARDNDLIYTRYADDITMSHKTGNVDLAEVLKHLEKTIPKYNLKINRSKTRFQRANKQMSVTGVVVNEKLNVPKYKRRKFRAKLHNLIKSGETVTPIEKQQLSGYANWINDLNPEQGKFFKEQVEKIPEKQV